MDARAPVRWRVQYRADDRQRRPHRRAGVADGEVSAHRRGLDGLEPRRLPAGNSGSRGRRLLAVRRREVRPIHVRLLSGKRTLAGQSDLRARRDPARSAACSARAPQGSQRDPVFRGLSGRGVLPAGRRPVRLAACGDPPLGRAPGHARHLVHRHHLLAAARHPARARTPLRVADRPHRLDRFHRVLARRAADHGPVLRHLHAAVLPARPLEDRRAAARADRRRPVRRQPTWPRSCAGGCRRCRAASSRRPWRSGWAIGA